MYLRITNGVPEKYSIGNLRRDNPTVSFPKKMTSELLESYGVFPYSRPAVSAYDSRAWRLIDDDFVQLEDGRWSLPYTLEAIPLAEAEQNVRYHRDSLLQETDWIVIKSYERGQNLPAEWELYRQALRDITEQAGFPYEVTWPTKP